MRAARVALLLMAGSCAREAAPSPVTVPIAPSPVESAPSPVESAPSPPPAPESDPLPRPVLEADAHTGIDIRSRHPHGGGSEARVRIAPDGSAVSIDWVHGKHVITRTYGRIIVEELVRVWGSSRFDISGWKSELCVGHTVTWTAEAGGHTRTLCSDGPEIRRLADFKASIQSMMKDP